MKSQQSIKSNLQNTIFYINSFWQTKDGLIYDKSQGNAFLINEKFIITAYHNIFNINRRNICNRSQINWPTNVNNNKIINLNLNNKYCDENLDLAVIQIESSIQSSDRLMSLSTLNDQQIAQRLKDKASNLYVAGFKTSTDAPDVFVHSASFCDRNNIFIFYIAQTSRGISGSPLILVWQNTFYIIGMHLKRFQSNNYGTSVFFSDKIKSKINHFITLSIQNTYQNGETIEPKNKQTQIIDDLQYYCSSKAHIDHIFNMIPLNKHQSAIIVRNHFQKALVQLFVSIRQKITKQCTKTKYQNELAFQLHQNIDKSELQSQSNNSYIASSISSQILKCKELQTFAGPKQQNLTQSQAQVYDMATYQQKTMKITMIKNEKTIQLSMKMNNQDNSPLYEFYLNKDNEILIQNKTLLFDQIKDGQIQREQLQKILQKIDKSQYYFLCKMNNENNNNNNINNNNNNKLQKIIFILQYIFV